MTPKAAFMLRPFHVIVGLLFGFIDYDGAVNEESINSTLKIFTQESVFRWSMAFFWVYLTALALWRYRPTFQRTPPLLVYLSASIGAFYSISATRLFVDEGTLSSFTVYEYRNLSLLAIVAIIVLNSAAKASLASFLTGWIVISGIRGWGNVGQLFLGAKQYQATLGVHFTSFDGTLLSQETVCAVLSLSLAKVLRRNSGGIAKKICLLLALGMILDNLGSFRRHVYLRIACILSFVTILIPSKNRGLSLLKGIGIAVLMSGVTVGIFGVENVSERIASYRTQDFSKTMDYSNEFYLQSWTLQWELAQKRPIIGYGLRSPLLFIDVNGTEIPIHTGFHTMWVREGVLGMLVQCIAFIIIPLSFLLHVRRFGATAGTGIIGALLAFGMFEGLFPFKDAVIGNIKACVAIGLALGLAIKRIEECKLRMVWIKKASRDQLELF